MKKLLFSFSFLLIFGLNLVSVQAQTLPNVYFFYGENCPHCQKEKIYLENLSEKYPNLKISSFEVYYNSGNMSLLGKTAEALNTSSGGVPFLVIGNKYFIGYSETLTPNEVENQIKYCLSNFCPDVVAKIQGIETEEGEVVEQQIEDESFVKEKKISLPFVGEIDAHNFSLPLLTVVMGLLDGFNPCAMWVLLFLISLLLGMENKKRMWILGLVFIFASAMVYFVFMSAWLNLILFLGFIIWVRIIIGLLALIGGGYNIKEFFINKDSGCKVVGEEKRQKIFQKIRTIINQNSFFLALGGIAVLAFMVNLVELVCSAGLPAVYVQILALNDLSGWQYYLYILFYTLFFMLDDIFVFVVAMVSLEMTGITTKYSKYSKLIGGLIMLFIGLSLIFKPEILTFG